MSASLFARFRQDYPAAELRVCLLTIHNDEYVVQAKIRLEGTEIISALAADRVIETAEDRACQRALERLGLPTPPPQPLTSLPDSANGTPSPEVRKRPSKLPDLPLAEEVPMFGEWEMDEGTAQPPDDPDSTSGKPDQTANTSGPALPLSPVADAPASKTTSENGALDGEDAPEMASLTIPQAAPVDLSDVIVQTDVELKRLGWGVSQGREFLERTYGKRSRHDLTDEELLEFLLYLESQPSP